MTLSASNVTVPSSSPPFTGVMGTLRRFRAQRRLTEALDQMDTDKVQQALLDGARLNPLEGEGYLLDAARRGRPALLTLLVERGANPDTVDPETGRTPLLNAVAACQDEAVLLLARYGVDLEHRDHLGQDAWDIASALQGNATWFDAPGGTPWTTQREVMTVSLDRVRAARIQQEALELRAVFTALNRSETPPAVTPLETDGDTVQPSSSPVSPVHAEALHAPGRRRL